MQAFILNAFEWCAGILGSVIVVYVSQVINDKYFEPKKEFSLIVRKAIYTLDYYANVISNPGDVKKELGVEASSGLRKVAMEFLNFSLYYPEYHCSDINNDKIKQIGRTLTGLSNGLGIRDHADINAKERQALKEMLAGKCN